MTGVRSDENFRPDVNALRALAVLAVIAFHFGLPSAASGYIGVDVFFVISGFLIGGQIMDRLERGRFSLVTFFSSRIRRIVPALAVLCAAVVAWGWLFQLPEDYTALTKSATSAIEFVSNRHFERQLGYFDVGAAYKPLLHTWSLSVEAQFYIALPFFLLLAWKLPRRWRPVATVAFLALSYGWMLQLDQKEPAKVFFSSPARAWEFLVGCLATRVSWTRQPPRLVLEGALTLCWAGLVAACLFLPTGVAWPGPWTLVPVLLTAAIIAIGGARPAGRVARNGLVQHLGTISYSLYLWHWPVIVCWRMTRMEDTVAPEVTAVLLAVTWGLAYLSWRYAEQPFRARAFWAAPRRLYGGWVASLVLFAAFGTAISRTHGIPGRLPTYIEAANRASNSHQDFGQCWDLPGANPKEPHHACEIGNPSQHPPTFAVWGDSHTLQFLDALRVTAAQTNAVSGYLFHYPGCEPSLVAGEAGPACLRHNQEVMRFLEGHPSVRTVVIAIRQNDERRLDSAVATADMLLAGGRRVIFLGPTQEAKRPVAQQWASDQLIQRRPIHEMAIDRDTPTRVASFDARLAAWRARVAPLQRKYGSRFDAVDLSPIWCEEKRCWLVKDDIGYFRDADHLTHAGAAMVMPVLVPRLLAEVPERAAASFSPAGR